MPAEITATYRLQLSKAGMHFSDAAKLIPYLSRLGISHLYLSPVLQASEDSEHGYDVADPTRVSDQLGGESGLRALLDKAAESGIRAVLDIVPNHLTTTPNNAWWWDVLRCGRASTWAPVFDLFPAQDGGSSSREAIVLPILGNHLAMELEGGNIILGESADGQPAILHAGQPFPINAEGVEMLSGGVTDPGELLEVQHYRLCHHALAADEINYRRFFNVPSLVGVLVEDPMVFGATHSKIRELVEQLPVDGLRVDHPDGLRDPADYLRKLRGMFPNQWIVAEKILGPEESLRREWPIDGTTGYDFLNMAGGLWIDPSGERELTDFYVSFTGRAQPYGNLVQERKRGVIDSLFHGDLMRLAEMLRGICRSRRLDYPRRTLARLLAETIAAFPIYRTYVQPDREEITEEDRTAISRAISAAARGSDFEPPILDLLREVLAGSLERDALETEFVARFQQMTGPVMAKGVEDTAFYCYDRLLALNEVGCDPANFGVSPERFHEHQVYIQENWPATMLATSTHDTKRSEDVRCRIALLSEIPGAWADEVRKWAEHNSGAWAGREPDRSAEHLFYQTLVGAWPIGKIRLLDYMRKAYREAGQFTSWAHPEPSYESRMDDFVGRVLDDPQFISMLESFIAPLIGPGRVNSLSQTLLKLTCPGIPDINQGCEIWNNSLVDPDNRRPVDFSRCDRTLRKLEDAGSVEAIISGMDDGLPKLHVIRETLALRRRHPEAFGKGPAGTYRPLPASGQRLGHLIAFSRGEKIAVVVPRLPLGVHGWWGDTRVALGPGRWRNVLDQQEWAPEVGISDLLARFPVALLEHLPSGS